MSPRGRITWAAALIAVALVGYLLAQRALGGSTSVTARTGSRAAHAAVASRSVARAPRAAHVRPDADGAPEAAVTAAARYLRLLDLASAAPATSAAVRAVTGAALTGRALAAEASAAALSRRLSGSGLALVRGWRLGWRVVSWRPPTAQVAVWAMGVVDSSHEVLTPSYSTTLCSLRLTDGRWRVDGAQTTAGPTPPADGSYPSAVAVFIRAAATFRSFGDAP